MKNIDIVAAKTHPPEYLLHKYWSRKPHNVISYFISQLVPNNGLVIDPFCGSGVVLRESQKLGINAIGFDANPIANLISKVLIIGIESLKNPKSEEICCVMYYKSYEKNGLETISPAAIAHTLNLDLKE
jgi:DNA modification methylase